MCLSWMLFRCFAIVVALGAISVAHAQAPTAATASEDPAKLDQIWQEASKKFDTQRAALLKEVDDTNRQGPFRGDWESLQSYEVPQWYREAKFGIFIHWGVYSVPAFSNEWYPRNMYEPGFPAYQHHLATYGPPDKFGYKDFIPMFKAEHFDPAAWAELFKKSGARYVVPVAEHHDGFAMYDSGLSDWTAVHMGPLRDVIGELATAVRAQGLHFGVSSHRVEHSFFLGVGRKISSDVNDPRYADFYGPAEVGVYHWGAPVDQDFTYVSSAWAEDWLARSAELVEKYHPDLVYFDRWIGEAALHANLARFAAFYYNASLKYSDHPGVINYKDYAMQEHAGVLDMERGQLEGTRELYWQTDTSVSIKSWGYIKDDKYNSPAFLIHLLADVVSKNGNLLLNVGPCADGTIPEQAQRVLLEIGSWLQVNGEAIYDTRPWRTYGEGPTKVAAGSFHENETAEYTAADFRFTTNNDALYAIGLAWPASGEAVIRSLATAAGSPSVRSVSLLAGEANIAFQQLPDGLHVTLPANSANTYAYVLRITFK